MNETNSHEIPPKHSVFLDYLHVLRRRKWTVLLCLAGLVIPVALLNYFSTPVYEAEATIMYEEPKDTMFALDVGQPFYSKSALINMTEQLKSRTLAEEVARVLPRQIIQTLKFPDPPPSDFSEDKFIGRQLQKNLTVEVVRGADILKIKVQANDPTAAKIIANTYVDRIREWNLRKKREEIYSTRDFVEKQLAVFQDKLNTAEEALRAFKEKNKMISLSDASTEILRRMTEAEVSYNQAKAEREALEQRQRYIAQKKQELAPTLTVASSPLAQQLKQRLAELEMQYSSRQVQGLSETQPDMITLKQKIDQTKQDLVQELLKTAQRENLIDPLSQIRNLLQESVTLEVDLETYKTREEGLKRIIADYDVEFQTLPKQELLLARLIRDRDVNDKIYSMLLEKREELRITEAGKIGDVQIIDAAEEPISPIKPKKNRNLALGFVLGLAIGLGLAFFLESLDTSIKSQEDVEKYVNLPVLASIPSIHTNGALSFKKKNHHTVESYSKKLFSKLNGNSHV
ncbi:MAG: GumC family protein, partial [candidate division KSB1 bacterium]|nr:GumC family protein [candidate division KSB1 bacterium]